MDRSNKEPQRKAFEGFVLDGRSGVLSRAGREIRLRPKTYAVLEYFVANPQRLLSKEELIEAVWPDSASADDSLTQCIAEIRRALGDEGRQLIKTLPKRGFTLDAAVSDQSELAMTLAKRGRKPILGLAAILVACAAYLSLTDSPDTTIRVPEPDDLIAVSDIVSETPNADSSAQLLREAVRLSLDELEGLSIRSVGTGGFEDAEPKFGELRSMDIDWAITGHIDSPNGSETHRVRFWLWDVGTEAQHSLGVFSIPRDTDTESTANFVALRDLVVERALGRLPNHVVESPASTGLPERLADFETYARVMSELEKEQCNPRLAPAMEPVVRNTPDFARGWMALAWSHWVDFWACGLGDESLTGAINAAEQVLAFRPNYPQAVKVKTSALAAMRNVDAALGVATAATEESPYEAAHWSTLSYLLNYTGDLDRSERAMDRALEIDPLVLVAETGETPNVYLYVGKWQRYLDTVPPFDSPFFNFQRAYAHFRAGDETNALGIASQTYRESPSDRYARFSAALIAIIEGNNDAATSIINGIVEERDLGSHGDGEVAYREAILFMLAGDTSRAFERLQTASAQYFICPSCVRRDPAWRSVLDTERFASWLRSYE